MIQNFVAYDLAIQLYRQCQSVQAKRHLKSQLDRASLSIALNLAEGAGKPTQPDKRRFYGMALGSLRETQAILQLLDRPELTQQAERLGGLVYRLVHPRLPG